MKSKILTDKSLNSTLRPLRRKKKRIVFTNGTFDILHAGHVRYLNKAKSCGDVLIVGVNSDSSVRSYKGPNRPINHEQDRLEVLSGLAAVDYVILFSEPTPYNLILEIRPDVLAKGADWKVKDIAGAREVKSWGGTVKRISFLTGRSTTNVIEKILDRPDRSKKKK